MWMSTLYDRDGNGVDKSPAQKKTLGSVCYIFSYIYNLKLDSESVKDCMQTSAEINDRNTDAGSGS